MTFDEKLVLVATNGNTSVKASLVGGSTQLYNDENGAYAISIANQACYLDSGSNFTSNWGGRMTLKPHNMNFTYSDCMGEKFVVNTTGCNLRPFVLYDGQCNVSGAAHDADGCRVLHEVEHPRR